MRLYLLSLLALLLALSGTSNAQQPFITDDADVTGKGVVHLEVSNQFDRLHRSAYPATYQDTLRVGVSYGVSDDLEFSVSGHFLTIAADEEPLRTFGIGDTSFGFKYNIHKDEEGSKLPAIALTGFVQLPTGDPDRGLGRGVTEFGFNGIAQKSVGTKNTWRVNTGYIYVGNAVPGPAGVSSLRGHVLTASTSFVRKVSVKLQLGGEIAVANATNYDLGKGQLQFQIGGNYQIGNSTTFDFAAITGRYDASPRWGLLLGLSHDW